MEIWAGRLLMALGTAHLVGLGVQNLEHVDDWFSGALWGLSRQEFIEPSGSAGAFWIVIGSFAVPLLLLGALITQRVRAGAQIAPSIGWGLLVWCLVGAAILEPTPLLLGLVPAVMLIRAARNPKAQASTPEPARH